MSSVFSISWCVLCRVKVPREGWNGLPVLIDVCGYNLAERSGRTGCVGRSEVFGWLIVLKSGSLKLLKSGNLNLLETSGPVQACNGIALPLFLFKRKFLYPVTDLHQHMGDLGFYFATNQRQNI